MKTTDIGIDLGSSKTVIFSDSKILLELPSVVTVDTDSWLPLYFGEKAYQTYGRTPESLTCVHPIQNGVIADLDLAEAMLTDYMKEKSIKVTVRGLRNEEDYKYETTMLRYNQDMYADCNTIFVPTPASLTYVSSSAIRNIISLKGDISPYVPEKAVKVINGFFK